MTLLDAPSLPARVRQALGRFVAPRHRGTEPKASATAPLIAFESLRQPVWTPRDYHALAREGFAQNAVVYRCVRMIAEAAASVPLLLYDGDEEIDEHPLKTLLARPNPGQCGPDLLEAWYGFLLVSGNAYLEAVAIGGTVRELHVLRPDRLRIVPGSDGWPEAWDYTVSGRTARLGADVVPGIRPVLHMKLFHPANDHYGMSPLEAAATAIDVHNAAARWNKALLDNSARPSGALVYTSREGNLTAEQYGRLKDELERGFQGAANAGRPLLLEGGLDWKSMSLSPKDLDFIEAKNAAAREIALALGVPPMLLGIPGDNTYSNMQEASRMFWRQTVLPLVGRTAKALSGWLAPAYASPIELRADLDGIEALSTEREALWTRIDKATFLTRNERRAAAGYGPVTGGDEIKHAYCADITPSSGLAPKANFNPGQLRDDLGRWIDAGGGVVHEASRRRGGRPEGTPAQEARHAVAAARAQDATRRLRELEPTWREPQSASSTIEGRIAHHEAAAAAAEARLAEILRDAIPNTNPSWGVNRLRKELNDRGFLYTGKTDAPGFMYENPQTGEQARIMERPSKSFRTDSPQKHFNDFYYRYRGRDDQRWGNPITIPNK
jgi:HK97 family phage portal protein